MELSSFFYLLCLFFPLALIPAIRFLSRSKHNKLPPGPTPLPVIGNLLQLGDKPHKSLTKLAIYHGPIMGLKLGQITTIIVSSPTLAKEVLQTHDHNLSDRTIPDAINAQDHHQSMEWLPVGPQWRKLRKICASHIFSGQKLDLNSHLRSKMIEKLVEFVRESCSKGKPVSMGRVAFTTMLNTLSSIMFSMEIADSSSERAREFKDVFRSIMHEAGKPNIADYFPVLRKIDPQGVRRQMSVDFEKLLKIFDGIIDERLELRKQNGYNPFNDVLDIILTLNEKGDDSETLDRETIKHLFVLLFVAGSDTTSTTLEWAMTELLKNPRTMSKLQGELEQTIGRGKIMEEVDLTRLPYLQAVVKETFRLHPSVPLLLPRKAKEDVEICGYVIPKGAQVLVNAWAIGRDESTWKEPNSFIPERFLGSDIDVRGKSFELIPFGGGRRICAGLPLATRMLHLMLGSLVNTFDWKIEDGVAPEVLDLDDKFGITLEKKNPLLAIPLPIA